ncbi:hypothetical protein KSP35_07655 [Aquihabitans sp. G128]|uniref:hypothetical protein n=1 Tax=Aquihabitans sp. G128 TaxID=2849779 RepID=UPI001C2127BF|nr:hypothetical protein [Aquihabitans sp. G128]QXC62660.1 hypothetical protein KSP35_07655 [Aquihabitans sp. G128]
MAEHGGPGGTEATGEDEAAGERPGAARSHRARHPVGGAVDDRPLLELAWSWTWARWLLVAAVLLRYVAVAGLRLYVYVDSGEYDRLDFTGAWRRPWATPLLYRLVPGDDHRLVVAQALVGALAWTVLALAAAAWFRVPSVRVVVAAALVALGCTTSVTNWDGAKLSESLALSLTVLVVAAWLNLLRRPTPVTGGLLLLATLPWLFVRQSLMPTAWMVAGLAVLGAVVAWRRRGAGGVFAGVAVGLVLLAGLASLSYGRNQEVVRENLTVIVANRVAPDADRLAWFRAHGMPTPASGALDYTALKGDPAFVRWVGGAGRGTYVRYLLTHPWYTATEPLEDLLATRPSYGDEVAPQSAMLAPTDAYGSSRPVEPELLAQLLFEPGGTGTVVAALGATLAWAVARRRRRAQAWVVPLGLVGLSLASLLVGWHGATPELGRLAIVGAVGLRIGLVLQLGLLVEGELLARRRTTAGGRPA